MLCPRCQQGDIANVKIKCTGELLYICQECEATWFSYAEIGNAPFVDFGTYMFKIGRRPLWSEVEVIDRTFE